MKSMARVRIAAGVARFPQQLQRVRQHRKPLFGRHSRNTIAGVVIYVAKHDSPCRYIGDSTLQRISQGKEIRMPMQDNATAPAAALPRYAVSLIDRRAGRPQRISDIPLRLITCEPFEAARDLMRKRDRALWDTVIHRLDQKGTL
jgi:hypothetical protein